MSLVRKVSRLPEVAFSATTEPEKQKKIFWPRSNRTVLMGEKAVGSLNAFLIARGQYPIYCQQIGRRIHQPIQCGNENVLASALMYLDWKVDHVIIRRAYGVPPSPQPTESYYLPEDDNGVIVASLPWRSKRYRRITNASRAA